MTTNITRQLNKRKYKICPDCKEEFCPTNIIQNTVAYVTIITKKIETK